MPPDPAYLRERLRYDPATGKLWWREHAALPANWNTQFAGREAFTATSDGYRVGRIDDRKHYAHRVIWALVTGSWPEEEIDHENHQRDDNRWNNLRDATHRANAQNATLRRDNTSGATGVAWHEQAGRWQAYIDDDGARRPLGLFSDFKEAADARRAAAATIGFHANHGAPKPEAA